MNLSADELFSSALNCPVLFNGAVSDMRFCISMEDEC